MKINSKSTLCAFFVFHPIFFFFFVFLFLENIKIHLRLLNGENTKVYHKLSSIFRTKIDFNHISFFFDDENTCTIEDVKIKFSKMFKNNIKKMYFEIYQIKNSKLYKIKLNSTKLITLKSNLDANNVDLLYKISYYPDLFC